ncbi:MAG: hypothetical protein HY675_12760 [Chloroflexi bacterium]|nr:hypothetical protein [Chloroflexota bacterium]
MPLPKKPIRRFDVFAEYSRIKYEQRGIEPERAKGYAIWLAKVIAARKLTKTAEGKAHMDEVLAEGSERMKQGARVLDLAGQPQTADVFDRLIAGRMGEDFYRQVFSPAVRDAIEHHRSYEKIRDAIREPWNERMAA